MCRKENCRHTADGICGGSDRRTFHSFCSMQVRTASPLFEHCGKNEPTPAGLHVATQGWVSGIPQRKHFLLGIAVVVVVVSSFVTVERPVVLLDLLLQLPRL